MPIAIPCGMPSIIFVDISAKGDLVPASENTSNPDPLNNPGIPIKANGNLPFPVSVPVPPHLIIASNNV